MQLIILIFIIFAYIKNAIMQQHSKTFTTMATGKTTFLELLDEHLELLKFNIIQEDYYDNLDQEAIINAQGIRDILDTFEKTGEGFGLLLYALDKIELNYTDKTIKFD